MTISEKAYIPINKGQSLEMDTPERIAEFNRKLGEGWEEGYQQYRREWIDLPNELIVRDYPILVDLELASTCNLRCPMCHTHTDHFQEQVKKGFMDYELIKRVIDEVAGKIYSLRLSFRGESTLHPKFVDAIAYAKSKGIKEVSSLTNGTRLDEDYIKRIVDAGLDWLSISIDGVDEEYYKIRKPQTFPDIIRKLEALKNYKEKNHLSKPVIKVQGVWPAIRPNANRYYETLAPLTDLVAFMPLIDVLNNDKESDIVFTDNFRCPQLYQRLVIGSDGLVLLCSYDDHSDHIIGNAYEQTVHELWHSDEMNQIRELHARDDGFKNLEVCRKCILPRKAVPNETALVGDREVTIHNYINRSQVIGE